MIGIRQTQHPMLEYEAYRTIITKDLVNNFKLSPSKPCMEILDGSKVKFYEQHDIKHTLRRLFAKERRTHRAFSVENFTENTGVILLLRRGILEHSNTQTAR